MKKFISPIVWALAGIVMVCYYSSCKKVDLVESTTTDVNIYEYLSQRPDSFSQFVKLIDKAGYSGFLSAYGAYTVFAPTNSGVNKYLTSTGKSIDAITEAEAQGIVKFHVIEDTLATPSFKDGKLPLVTMYGQFLITGINNDNGNSVFVINRQATVNGANIRAGNGIIHSIDNVLQPAKSTLAQLIDANPDYSIFKQALVATGYWDTLNTINSTDPSRRWLTVLAETNKALADSGITSFNALKAKYSQLNNPLNPLDSLHIYVAYHIIPDAKYLADIVSASSHFTLAPLEVLTSKLDGTTVLINDMDFNGVHETGIQLNRNKSDVSSTTGVLHEAMGHFAPKIRVPYRVDWDVADFTEVRKLPAVFRKANYSFLYGAIKDINWDKTTNTIDYVYNSASNAPHYYNDYLQIPMGNTSRHFWIDFTTPLIVKGRYKVWINYRAGKQSGSLGQPGGSYMPVQPYFNGQPLSRSFAFTEQRPNLSDGEMEALGWKRYTVSTQQNMTGKFLGIVDVPTTSRHVFRLQALPGAGTGQTANYLDMIQFIPIDQNQYLPRFDRNGALVYN